MLAIGPINNLFANAWIWLNTFACKLGCPQYGSYNSSPNGLSMEYGPKYCGG